MKHLMYRGQESKTFNYQLISPAPVTLKQSQGHQTTNDNADPKQGYNHAKLKDLTLMVSEKKPMLKGCVFSFQRRKCQLSALNMCENQKYWFTPDPLDAINNCTKFQLNQKRNITFSILNCLILL